MKKYKNAFALKDKNFNCFGCSPYNSLGLQIEFFSDENNFWSEWVPRDGFDGWKGIVHGGIQSCIIDETAEWLIFTKYGRAAMTTELNIKYKRPLESVIGKIKAYASVISFERNIAEINVNIVDINENICTIGSGKFYVLTIEDSKTKCNFPDLEEF